MPVMGPSVNEEQAKRAFDELLASLQEKWKILNFPPSKFWAEKRAERIEAFRLAVRGLFEIDSWEGF